MGMFLDFVVGTNCVCVCDGNIRVKRNCTFVTEWWVGEQLKNFIGRCKKLGSEVGSASGAWSGMPRKCKFLEFVVFHWLRISLISYVYSSKLCLA